MGAEGRGLGLYTALPTPLPLSREAATLPRDRQTEAPTKAKAKEETPNIRECAPGPEASLAQLLAQCCSLGFYF